jgi:hypothetical protein
MQGDGGGAEEERVVHLIFWSTDQQVSCTGVDLQDSCT